MYTSPSKRTSHIDSTPRGAPISDYFPGGTLSIIAKNADGSVTGLTPNNLSQSRIGLSGLEPIGGEFSFVFPSGPLILMLTSLTAHRYTLDYAQDCLVIRTSTGRIVLPQPA